MIVPVTRTIIVKLGKMKNIVLGIVETEQRMTETDMTLTTDWMALTNNLTEVTMMLRLTIMVVKRA
jgi:phosphoribosylformylglycinamidine (FGAM) synthase-like amidotransferase family enzyme